MHKTKRRGAEKFTPDEITYLVALVGKRVDPDDFNDPKTKALVYKCQSAVEHSTMFITGLDV